MRLATLGGLWRRYRSMSVGIVLLTPFILFALVPNLFAPYEPLKISVKETFEPPSPSHWFGTDELGRDVFSRVVYASRLSLSAALITILIATVIGVITGVIAGYWGGVTDRVIMSIADMVLSFPSLILAMAVAAALGPSLLNSMLAVAAVWWPIYTRLMRALTMQLTTQLYVEASRASGANAFYIIRRHILPNSVSAINVRLSLDLGYAVITLASLGFLGLGVSAPTPEWGAMVSWGRTYFLTYWWIGAFPSIAIVLVVVGTSLLGDSLNDLWNPNLEGSDV